MNCLVDTLYQSNPAQASTTGLLTSVLEKRFQEAPVEPPQPGKEYQFFTHMLSVDTKIEPITLTLSDLQRYYGPSRIISTDWAELDKAYVMPERSAIKKFISDHRLRGLLIDAVKHLDAAFGVGAIKRLELIRDDEGFENLCCSILFAGPPANARLALRAFDARWWLAHCQQADGRLNFDFELV